MDDEYDVEAVMDALAGLGLVALEIGDLRIQVRSYTEIAEVDPDNVADVEIDLDGLRALAARGAVPGCLRFLLDDDPR